MKDRAFGFKMTGTAILLDGVLDAENANAPSGVLGGNISGGIREEGSFKIIVQGDD